MYKIGQEDLLSIISYFCTSAECVDACEDFQVGEALNSIGSGVSLLNVLNSSEYDFSEDSLASSICEAINIFIHVIIDGEVSSKSSHMALRDAVVVHLACAGLPVSVGLFDEQSSIDEPVFEICIECNSCTYKYTGYEDGFNFRHLVKEMMA